MATRLVRSILSALFLLGLVEAVQAQGTTPIRIRDLGQERDFFVSDREVYVIHRTGNTVGGLRRRLEAGVPGALVSGDTETRALVKLSAPLNRADAAAGHDPVSTALPDVEVLPVIYASGTVQDENSRRFATREVLVPLPQNETIQQLAASVGAVASRSTIKPGYYILTFPTPYQAFDAVKTLRTRALDAQPLVQRVMARKAFALPKDRFFPYQWHLVNTGQDNGAAGVDVNILGAWNVTKGAETTIAIVDDCLQTLHPDLTDACPALAFNFHHDFNDNDNDPRPNSTDAHGTACAGVAAARQNNGNLDANTGTFLGVTGAAPECRLFGLRLISAGFTDDDSSKALFWHPGTQVVDVSSNSWGPPDGYYGLAGPDILTREALRSAAVEGRNGLGQVTCFAAGNGLFYGDNSNYDGFANSRYVVAVGALGHRGKQAIYSEPGDNILVTAPSQGDFASIAITTTDVTGIGGYNPQNKNPSSALNLPNTDYTNTFNGTSSACPLVAGCVSLILAANKELGWRDVKEILAMTANRVDDTDVDWVTSAPGILPQALLNGAQFHFSHKYGAGLINVSAAVARAQQWKKLGGEFTQTRTLDPSVVPAPIPDLDFNGVQRDFDFSGDPNIRVEQIEVIVDVTHPHRSDLEVTITSPDGTVSRLADTHFPPFFGSLDTDADIKDYTVDFSTGANVRRNQGWTFTTTHHWGENSNANSSLKVNGKGVWRLRVADQSGNAVGTLNAATVNLYGTSGPNGIPAPETRFAFAAQRYGVPENAGPAKLDVMRVGDLNGAADVDFITVPGTALEGSDYTPLTGTLHFSPGNQFADTQVSIALTNDSAPESTESFYVLLKDSNSPNPPGSLGGASIATVDIFDDEENSIEIAAGDTEAGETDEGLPKNTGSFIVSRLIAQPTPLTVKFQLLGTAILGNGPGDDYSVDTQPENSLSVTIPALQKSITVTVSPRNDNLMEGTETVIMNLLPDPSYSPGIVTTATVNIRDNDLPLVQLLALDDFASENPTDTATCRVQQVDSNGQPLISQQPLTIFLNYRGTQIPPTQPNPNFTVMANGNPVINAVDIPAGSDHVDLIITPVNDGIYQPTKTIVLDLQVNPNYSFSFGFLSSAKVNVVEDEAVPETGAPTVTIAEPSAKSINSPDPVTISGKATDNDQVQRVTYRLNGGVWKIADGMVPATNVDWTKLVTADVIAGVNQLEVQAIDIHDNLSKIATKQFTYVVKKDLTITVLGTGAFSKGFVAGANSLQVGQTYSITATPGAGKVFDGWTGLVNSNNPTISFTMPNAAAALTAKFVDNPFTAAIAGNYSGLIRGNPFTAQNSGYLFATVANTGVVSGKLTLNGITYSFKSAFTGSGKLDLAILRKSDTALQLHLDLDLLGAQKITGSVKFGSFNNAVTADRAAYGKGAPAPPAVVKAYTLVFPAPAIPVDAQKDPRGHGVGTMTIDTNGIVKWAGTLGDGTKASQSQPLSKNNTWPLFVSLYKKGGVILGDVTVDSGQLTTDLTGPLNWFKPPTSKDHFFPIGFKVVGLPFKGSIYVAPTAGTRALAGFLDQADNGKVTLEEGNTGPGFTHKITLAADNSVIITDPTNDLLAVKLNTKNGTVTGTFVHPLTSKKTNLNGVLFQKEQTAYGQFLGTLPQKDANPQTGRVKLEHVP